MEVRDLEPPETIGQGGVSGAPGQGQDARGGLLNLKQAAARLGVHYMTAYRYVRQGLLAGERVGTEWRVSEEALVSFTNRRRAPSGPVGPATGSAGPAEDGAARWRERLGRCLLAGDEPAAWRTVQSALAAGHPPAFCYVDMLAASLVSIEARWEAGELAGADQYLATAVATRVVSRLGARVRRPGRSRGTVVFGAPEGELQGLPVAIAADLVRLVGFDVLELGANVPAEAFAGAVARARRLVGVGIGLTGTEALAAAQATVDAVRTARPTVPVVAGGWPAGRVDGVNLAGVTAWVCDGRDAMRFFDQL